MCRVSVSPESSSKVILLYRSSSISQAQIVSDLNNTLTYIEKNQVNVSVLLGDFNVDALNQVASSALTGTMNRFGWKQMVTKATHRILLGSYVCSSIFIRACFSSTIILFRPHYVHL